MSKVKRDTPKHCPVQNTTTVFSTYVQNTVMFSRVVFLTYYTCKARGSVVTSFAHHLRGQPLVNMSIMDQRVYKMSTAIVCASIKSPRITRHTNVTSSTYWLTLRRTHCWLTTQRRRCGTASTKLHFVVKAPWQVCLRYVPEWFKARALTHDSYKLSH